MSLELAIWHDQDASSDAEARLIALVLDGVTSVHSRRSYRTGLAAFFAWVRASDITQAFSKALVH